MRIDNGERRPLIISGVFDGICGISRGVLAFTPNRSSKRPQDARSGILDGEPVMLVDVMPSPDGRAYTARAEPIR